ncbi:MAG: M20/M25/M40 family metallo-hydrolase [candidate division WOR-3 bacterium]
MNDLLNLTLKLVEVPSVAQNPEALKKVIGIADDFLPQGLIRHRYEREGRPSMVVSFVEGKRPETLFLAHLDVVDAKPEQFRPRLEGDKLYARGALDMKGPSAAMLAVFRDLYREGKCPSAALMLTTDEEIGSANGVAYLVRDEGWSGDFVVIPDGGPNFSLVTKGKGAFHIRVFAKGKAVHGSAPWAGDNAIDRIIGFYEELKRVFATPEPCGDEGHWHQTLNIGLIKGGKKVNIVPDEAEASFDIRFTEAWSVARVDETVKDLAERHGLSYEVESTGEPFNTPLDEPHLVRFARCMEEVLGHPPVPGHEHGATDGRFFSEKGIPTVITYPEGWGIHGDEEWVSVSSLAKLYRIIRKYLEGE